MKLPRAGLIVGILAFLVLAYIFFPECTDDAYITLRYARNLFLGNGPVFNPGERVEGYSNFLWMAMLSAFGWAGAPMEVVMKLLSLISGLGALAMTWKFSSRFFKSGLAVMAAMILLGGSSFFALWAVDGLETVFYTFLLTLLAYLLAAEEGAPLLIGLLAGLIALTRPEGVMFSLIAAGMTAFNNKSVKQGLLVLAPAALLWGGYELFRMAYFGEPVPNTALVKVHPGLEVAMFGLRYFAGYFAQSGYVLLPFVLAGAMASTKQARLRVPAVFVLAQTVFLMVSGGDFMFGYRFVVPVMPCIAILCAAGFDWLHERVQRGAAAAALGVVVLVQPVCQYASLPAKHIGPDNLTYRASTLRSIAEFLSPRCRPQDWILISEAGIIPYYVNAQVMDYIALVSPYHSIYRPSYSSDYLFSVKPRFMVVSLLEMEDGSIRPRLWMENRILANPEMANYVHVRDFGIPNDGAFSNAGYYKYALPGARRAYFSVYERID